VIVVWIVLGVIVVIAIAGVISYNRFVTQKNLIKDAWANIDTELRRRYDLIPNLVETVKGYATHEREVFEEVTRARASAAGATGSPAAQAAAEGPFMAALGKLFAVAEAYPDLKANQNFLALQSELSNTEDRLQTARRFYNANVREFNTRLQAFPSSVIAGMFHFEPAEFFEIPDEIREAGAPQVDFSTPAADPAAPPNPPAPAAPATEAPSAPPGAPPAPPAPPVG
jgi:LemA protein